MNKKICLGVLFLLISTSFFVTNVNATEEIVLEVEGSNNGVIDVEMAWDLSWEGGVAPYSVHSCWDWFEPYGGPGGFVAPGWQVSMAIYQNYYTSTHTYSEVGDYIVKFKVKDSEGTWSNIVELTVRVGYVEAGGPYVGVAGIVPVYFDGDGYYPSGGKDTVRWDFGDGNFATEIDPTHLYEQDYDNDDDEYIASLTYTVPPWSGTDTADVTIYTDHYELSTQLMGPAFVFKGMNARFLYRAHNAPGFHFTPPFRLYAWVEDNQGTYEPYEILDKNYLRLQSGTHTNWENTANYPCTGHKGGYTVYLRVYFPGTEIIIGSGKSWGFLVI